MQTVIGLGQAGCNIADQLKQYPQYKIIKIDTGLKKTKTSFGLKHQASPELYEEKLPRGMIKYLQEEVMPETLFITSCGMVSGASLSILEKIKDKTLFGFSRGSLKLDINNLLLAKQITFIFIVFDNLWQ